MARDYAHELQDLVDGKTQELRVDKDEFMDFQKVWLEFGHRKEIIGDAQRNGEIIYRFAESGHL